MGPIRPKKKLCVFQVSAWKNLDMELIFYFILIFCIMYFRIFLSFFCIFDSFAQVSQ